jgi:hypothetical protein
MVSRPPSPNSRTESPATGTGYFSTPFERFIRDEASDWAGAFTLLGKSSVLLLLLTMSTGPDHVAIDTMETFFDSRLDLLQRQIQKHSDRLKFKAEEALKKRVQSSDVLAENFDREVKNFKLKVRSGDVAPMVTDTLNPGFGPYANSGCIMAFCEGREDPRQSDLFPWCHVAPHVGVDVWLGSSVRTF